MRANLIRFTAKIMLMVMVLQLVLPATRSFALTTGPSQPEVQSFEPVGTTEMVDLFSGDFVYNIPLMDIEGYPVNIAYHSGINMEQESSWVGLGWNINPGEINRNVRGIPDDFNGDSVKKILNVNPEITWRTKGTIQIEPELFGANKLIGIGATSGLSLSYNNYKGLSAQYENGIYSRLKFPYCSPQIGVGMSVGSQEGTTVDANASVQFATSKTMNESGGTLSFSGSTGFNTRSGLMNVGLGTTLGLTAKVKGELTNEASSVNTHIPIGLQNYVPVVTNISRFYSSTFSVKFGVEIAGLFPGVVGSISQGKLTYDAIGSRKSFGYLYAQNAGKEDIMDFSREKDGMYNETMPNLPLSSMTYDVYSVSSQGGGGMYRPFRNDIGSVFDPYGESESSMQSLSVEGGTGAAYEFGGNYTTDNNTVKSGPWFRRAFSFNGLNSLYENVYFKQAGELTYSLMQDQTHIVSHNPVAVTSANKLIAKGGANLGNVPGAVGNAGNGSRSSRAALFSFLTNREAALSDIGQMKAIENYPVLQNGSLNAQVATIPRQTATTGFNKSKSHHIGEITQTLPDGRRYVYAIPAMNNIQKEVTFTVNNGLADITNGLVTYSNVDDSRNNQQGVDHYYQATYTPAYAHSYLLTSVLSPDYMDITGDGLTEDDLGSYTKINYSRTDADFRWIAPIQAAGLELGEGVNKAQYNPGFWSDPEDDKGNYTMGSKEMWYMQSIESKNMIAEFYISPRADGAGVRREILNGNDNYHIACPDYVGYKDQPSLSYKLDSIKLFSKHDRIVNAGAAVPVKTVIFQYDYSLCAGVPNFIQSPKGGKLTLKRIYFRYGNSDKSLMNPYEFTYSDKNPNYNFALKDRWGSYKPADPTITNYEFPYVKQDKTEADINAYSWHLTGIKLPSGGNLSVQYEADDYSYVQDKRAMEMVKIAGVGSSKAFAPKDVLYEDMDNQYQYIYFQRSKGREFSDKSFRENYFGDEKTVYFSVDVDVTNKGRYEHITGYALIADESDAVGACDDNYGYVRVKLEKAGIKEGQLLSPVTLAALNKGRYYLPHLMYKGYQDNTPLKVLKSMVASFGEMLAVAGGPNKYFVRKKHCKKIIPQKSWLRLMTPGYTKIGGGSRVKRLEINDAWANMTSNTGSNAAYGQQYFYKTLLDNKWEISSGVASYEPMIGADEIPQRRPANRYTADGGRLLPAIEFNQEEPFGESFYPGPSVGYSKVTVASIHVDVAKSAQALNVQEYYTAKDFPVQTDFTEKSVPVNTHEMSFSSRFDEVNVIQGYALIMNDMHGKAKAATNYVIKTDQSGRGALTSFSAINKAPKELITSTRYNYNTQNGRLYNKVKAVKRSLAQPTYSVTDMVLGEETDFTVDNRMRDMDSKSMNISANLNVIGLGIFIIPIPSVFFPDSHEKNVFKTMVATKVIQQYGILKSVETVDHGARVVSENVLYDSETGQPLLTTVNNEYDDVISNISLPAYWAYDNMGPAYFNIGYEEIVDSVYIDQYGKGYLMGLDNKRNFNLGDELMVKLDGNTYRTWVTDMQPIPCACGPAPGAPPPVTPPGGSSSYTTFGSVSSGNPSVASGCRKNGNEEPKWWKYDGGSINRSYYWNGSTWVEAATSNIVSGMPVIDCPPGQICDDKVFPVIEPRAKFINGDPAQKWISSGFKQYFKKVYVKVIRSGRRNMLGAAAENIAVKGAFNTNYFINTMLSAGNIANVLSSSAVTYTDKAMADDFTAVEPFGFNDYVLGKKGNYRESESYVYLTDRNYDNPHTRTSGIYTIPRFWVAYTNNLPCSLSDVVMQQDAYTSGLWRLVKKVTQYSAYGMPLEEQNASGIYSTAVYGYNNALPVAVGSNMKKGSLKYFNFEDLTLLNPANYRKLGVGEQLNSTTWSGASFSFRNNTGSATNYIQYSTGNNNFGSGIIVDDVKPHTGKYSLKFSTSGKIRLADINNYETSGDNRFCYISMWVRPVSTISTAGVSLRGFGKTSNPLASQDFSAFAVKTNSIDGWYKLEGKIDMALLATYKELQLVMPAGYNVDDIRLYPDKGNMKSFAYDSKTMRLMAELDENNFATFYEYDQEGVLIRVKKESDRGILTVSENRKANAKNN